jgi:hypothetical protein
MSRQAGKGLAETARGTDVAVKEANKKPADIARGTDAVSKEANKIKTDTAAAADSASKQPGKGAVDTARGTDTVTRVHTAQRLPSDTARGTDVTTKQLGYSAGGDGTAVLSEFAGLDYRQDYLGLLPQYQTKTFTAGENIAPFSNDMFEWANRGAAGANNCLYSRDHFAGQSPADGIPLKMIVTGLDPHIGTYNGNYWSLAPAAIGETWTISVYVKADVATTGQLFLFGYNAAGTFVEAPAGGVSITTSWTRVSYTTTLVNSSTVSIGYRLDGPDAGGGQTIWWDGVQLEKAPAPTFYKPSRTNIKADTLMLGETFTRVPGKGVPDTVGAAETFTRTATYIRGGVTGGPRSDTYAKTSTTHAITYTSYGNNRVVSTATTSGTPSGYYTATRTTGYTDWNFIDATALTGAGGAPRLIRFLNGQFVYLRDSGTNVSVYTSTTPQTAGSWALKTTFNLTTLTTSTLDIAYDSITGYYVILSTNSVNEGIISARSTDLIDWTVGTVQTGATTSASPNHQLIAENGAFYVPGGNSYESVNRSTDGLNWTRALNGFFADQSHVVYYSKNFNQFYAGVSDTKRYYSLNGITWPDMAGNSPDFTSVNIADGNDGFLYWVTLAGSQARICRQTTALGSNSITIGFFEATALASSFRGAMFTDGAGIVIVYSNSAQSTIRVFRIPYYNADTVTSAEVVTKQITTSVGGDGAFVQNDFVGIDYRQEYLGILPTYRSKYLDYTNTYVSRNVFSYANNLYGYITDLPITQSRTYNGLYDQIAPPVPSPVGGAVTRITAYIEGSLFQTYTIPIPMQPGEKVTFSWYIYAQGFTLFGGSNNTTYGLYNPTTGVTTNLSQVAIVNSNDSWQRKSVTITNNNSVVSYAQIWTFNASQPSTNAPHYWIDGFQMELGSTETTFVTNIPVYPQLKADIAHAGDSKSLTIGKVAVGDARTRYTEFTPVNYTQDLLTIVAPDL